MACNLLANYISLDIASFSFFFVSNSGLEREENKDSKAPAPDCWSRFGICAEVNFHEGPRVCRQFDLS